MCEYITGSYTNQSELCGTRSYCCHQGIYVLVSVKHSESFLVVADFIIFLQDIFRKYPNKYESIISTLCENLDSLDESEARYCIESL